MSALANTTIVRADRHAHNRALHAAGLPTLGSAHTRADYLRTLPTSKRADARVVLGLAPVARKAQPKAAPVVPAQVRETPEFILRRAHNKARKAQGLAPYTQDEFAAARELTAMLRELNNA